MPPRKLRSLELFVRGEIPKEVEGRFFVAMNRRHKDRTKFSRWHDSQADLLRLDVVPGRPGRVTASVIEVDPSGEDLGNRFGRSAFEVQAYGKNPAYGYATQPNHGVNVADGRLWATNLLFGAPLEMEIESWEPTRILRYVEPSPAARRVSTTAHFAWSRDKKAAYFHQSLLTLEQPGQPVRAEDLKMVKLDLRTGTERTWALLPPRADPALEPANFHSAFLWEEDGFEFVGLLRTGAVLETLAPHQSSEEHAVVRMPTSTIWYVKIDDAADTLQAELLPGLEDFHGLAMSHLDVHLPNGEGFVLYANCKQSDVAEETHGQNIYGQTPDQLTDHYSGMVAEALNYGSVVRYERKNGAYDIRIFERPYDARYASEGHTWLPINIQVDRSAEALYCSFSGFRPRLLPRHVYKAYSDIAVDPARIRYVPPLIMRVDGGTLQPSKERGSRARRVRGTTCHVRGR
jgi:Retinal pigment epithelial membrane protein